MAAIAAAYRGGATDAEALKDGTGKSADQLYADYFRSFGAAEPQPVAAATIGPSVVRPGQNGGAAASAAAQPADGASQRSAAGASAGWVAIAVLGLVVVLAGAWYWRRRGIADE
jgi:hypothetical protein